MASLNNTASSAKGYEYPDNASETQTSVWVYMQVLEHKRTHMAT